MKKILALTLAAVMAAGMTTVAFADTGKSGLALRKDSSTEIWLYYDKDGKDGIDTTNEDDVIKPSEDDVIAGGKTLYIPIFEDNTVIDWNNVVTDGDDVDGWKVDTNWTRGKSAKKPYIDSVKIDGDYVYAIAIELPESEGKAQDLVGTITLYSTRTGNDGDKKDTGYTETQRTVEIGLEYGYKTEDFDEVDDFADAQIVDFDDCDGEEDLDFGDYMTFTVNLDGQGKLNLKNNTKFVSEIADLDKSANMDFITFEQTPSFNKVGTAYIYAADDTYLYEVVDGKLEAVDAKYNEDYEAWEFKTRTLGQYVISDKELDLESITDNTDDKDDSSSTTEDGNKKNPDTGR